MAYFGPTAIPSIGRDPIALDDPETQRQITRLHRRIEALRVAFASHEPDAARRARWLGRLDDMKSILASPEPDLRGVERAVDAIDDLFPTAPAATPTKKPRRKAASRSKSRPDPAPVADDPDEAADERYGAGWLRRLWHGLRSRI